MTKHKVDEIACIDRCVYIDHFYMLYIILELYDSLIL